jgi:hypothetical protein
VVATLPSETETGIYFGWAKVDEGAVHKMVMSVGWNPYYHNERKSMVSSFVKRLRDAELDSSDACIDLSGDAHHSQVRERLLRLLAEDRHMRIHQA